jgi:hypothetical protein
MSPLNKDDLSVNDPALSLPMTYDESSDGR